MNELKIDCLDFLATQVFPEGTRFNLPSGRQRSWKAEATYVELPKGDKYDKVVVYQKDLKVYVDWYRSEANRLPAKTEVYQVSLTLLSAS